MAEPLIHSHIEDCLPEDHPLAWKDVKCSGCDVLVHSGNECMQTWVEMPKNSIYEGIYYCAACFGKRCKVLQ